MAHLARACAVALFAAGSALPLAADEASDQAAIRDLWETYQTAWVDGDADAWLALWDDEGIQMPPGAPPRDFDALQSAVRSTLTPAAFSAMQIDPQEIEILGDVAYARGVYTLEGPDMMMDGKFMTILHRQDDGSWKIYRDIFNANSS